MKYAKVRDVLNELKWSPGGNKLAGATVYIQDRTRDDLRPIPGSDILEVHRTWLYLGPDDDGMCAMIPLYKVTRIVRDDGVTIWERPAPTFVGGKLVNGD